MVKGHSSCGAITAAVEDSPTDSVHLTSLIKAIQPVVREHMTIDAVTIAHTKDVAHAITERSSILGQVTDLMITSCFYRIDTGEMVWG